jgi:hypothetical protein
MTANYTSAIARTGTLGTNTDPLVPEPMIAEVIKEATQNSAALSQFRQVTMAAGTTRQPVLSVLPTAYWVPVTPDSSRPRRLSGRTSTWCRRGRYDHPRTRGVHR